jgi:hypothetical protein
LAMWRARVLPWSTALRKGGLIDFPSWRQISFVSR